MKFLKVNATEIPAGIIAHGVNRQLAMGSGIAGALAKKWPIVREQYLTRNPVPKLGSVDLVYVDYVHGPGNLYVANCYTQHDFGPGDKRYACPDAISLAVSKVLMVADRLGGLPVYLPRIGCELGGLDWFEDVKWRLQDEEDWFNDLLVDNGGLKKVELNIIDLPGGAWGDE